jgi:murein DD-endopeptidase MepM/ murein hydrolase activator NlpD
MIKDYKNRIDDTLPAKRRFHPLALLALPLALGASGLYAALQILEPAPQAVAIPETPHQGVIAEIVDRPQTPTSLDAPLPAEGTDTTAAGDQALQAALTTTLEETAPETPVDLPPDIHWKEHPVRSGDNLALIFSRLDLSANLLHRIVNSSKEAAGLANIRPGELLRVGLDEEGSLQELILRHNAIRSLHITPAGDSFKTQMLEREVEPRVTHTSGTVESSLFISAQEAGLADPLIMELANIFGWDIDFALEIRAGDHFSVVYQEDYLDGKKFRDGPILAAEFVNKGRSFRALRYVDETGRADYFTPEGKSVRKAFLRSPVDFRRISSRFQKERWHPVLGKKRPHRGVDYAAATGTPIKASGDGRISFIGRKGGYGKTVILEHGGGITTLYAHLSRYKAKQKNGTRVRQGDIIGYVGQTGLSSGPHLHYEFRVNGTHRNPLTVKLPSAQPIASKYKEDFAQQAAPLLAQLEALGKTLVADAN